MSDAPLSPHRRNGMGASPVPRHRLQVPSPPKLRPGSAMPPPPPRVDSERAEGFTSRDAPVVASVFESVFGSWRGSGEEEEEEEDDEDAPSKPWRVC